MAKIHQAARAHFARQRETLESVDVPEWESTIYYYAVMSQEERAAIARHIDHYRGYLDPAAIVTTLIMRARDENGRRLFGEANRKIMETDYDPAIMQHLCDVMNSRTPDPDETQEKKDETKPTIET